MRSTDFSAKTNANHKTNDKIDRLKVNSRNRRATLNQLPIIFIDDFYVAISKPEGLLVHPSMIDKSEKECAMKQLRDQLGRWVYPIHRLDRPTSGTLIFGLSSESAAALAEQFALRSVQKRYLALVRGFTQEDGLIDKPLKELWDKMTDRDSARAKPAQEAITEYHLLEKIELKIPMPPHPSSRYSLLEVLPHTGRQRQIRRHLKSIFHPIIGDPKHGDGAHNRMFKEHFELQRLMLHARQLNFIHPFTGRAIEIAAPVPCSFSEILEKIGMKRL